MLCVSLYVCVQNMCLWLSVCDLQQHTLVAVMSIQVVVVLKSSQSHTHTLAHFHCVFDPTHALQMLVDIPEGLITLVDNLCLLTPP